MHRGAFSGAHWKMFEKDLVMRESSMGWFPCCATIIQLFVGMEAAWLAASSLGCFSADNCCPQIQGPNVGPDT